MSNRENVIAILETAGFTADPLLRTWWNRGDIRAQVDSGETYVNIRVPYDALPALFQTHDDERTKALEILAIGCRIHPCYRALKPKGKVPGKWRGGEKPCPTCERMWQARLTLKRLSEDIYVNDILEALPKDGGNDE